MVGNQIASSPDETDNWNMATQTLKRMSSLLDACSVYSIKEDFVTVFLLLKDLSKQLSPFMKPGEFEEIESKFNQLPSSWRVGKAVHPKVISTVNKTLFRIEVSLLLIMKRESLLMKKKDDPGKALLG